MRKVLNNSGVSSILFAMIFTIVMSLLAVGFARLVRNDQRQTLDQSLGYQAQYAAETAINQTYEYLRNNPTADKTRNTCEPGTNYEIIDGSSVRVTCVTWDATVKDIVIKPLATGSLYSTQFYLDPADTYTRLRIEWSSTNQGTYGLSSNLPGSISSSNYSVLRLTTLKSGSTAPSQIYIVPTGSVGPPLVNLSSSGSVASAYCNAGKCTANLDNAGYSFMDGYLSLLAIGQDASSVTISAVTMAGDKRDIQKSQFRIDATAVAVDVVKRVEARMPVLPQTWRPWFAGSSGNMCKDIKIDGTNDNPISSSVSVCPN